MSLEEYMFALSDLQYAIKSNIPHSLKGEAYWRMGICYKATNEENKANVSFSIAEKLLGNNPNLEYLKKYKESVNVRKNIQTAKGICYCFT